MIRAGGPVLNAAPALTLPSESAERPDRHPHAFSRDPRRALRGASWTPAPNCCPRWPSTPVNLVPVPRTGISTEDMIETSGPRNTRRPPPLERRGHLLETPSTRHDFRRLRLPRYRSTLTTTTATRERLAHLPGTRFSGSGSSLSRSARSSASSCTPRLLPSGSPRWRHSSAVAASELSSEGVSARPSSSRRGRPWHLVAGTESQHPPAPATARCPGQIPGKTVPMVRTIPNRTTAVNAAPDRSM